MVRKILVFIISVLMLPSCSDRDHEDINPRVGTHWEEVSLMDTNGVIRRLSCPVKSHGYKTGHNNGCYLKKEKEDDK